MFSGQPNRIPRSIDPRDDTGSTGPPGKAVVLIPTNDIRCRAALEIADRLHDAGHRALLAGGCVRDLLLGRKPKDYDIATSATPDRIEKLFERTLAVGKAFGVIVVMTGDIQTEVATFRRDLGYEDGRHPTGVAFSDARADAERRDFTINALFYDPFADEVLDYVGGHQDLWGHWVRAVGDPDARFAEDRLRMLRAVRFAARLGFDIEQNTAEAIRRNAFWVTEVSGERIRQELEIILSDVDTRARAVRLADDLGLLDAILPELTAGKGVEQGETAHPEGDVFVHSVLCLEKLRSPDFVTALGALVHDIGKPPTRFVDETGVHFYEHQNVGARMAKKVARRLKLSKREEEKLVYLVDQHMQFMHLPRMKQSTAKRLFAEPDVEALMEVYRADCLASGGTERSYNYVREVKQMLEKEVLKPAPLVTGHDLIEMGLIPGPRFSEILDEVYDRQLEGQVKTRQEALRIVRERAGV